MLAGYLICSFFNSSWIGNISRAAAIVGEVFHSAPSQMRPRSIHLICGSNWLTTHLAVVVCKLPSPNSSSVFSTRSLSVYEGVQSTGGAWSSSCQSLEDNQLILKVFIHELSFPTSASSSSTTFWAIFVLRSSAVLFLVLPLHKNLGWIAVPLMCEQQVAYITALCVCYSPRDGSVAQHLETQVPVQKPEISWTVV